MIGTSLLTRIEMRRALFGVFLLLCSIGTTRELFAQSKGLLKDGLGRKALMTQTQGTWKIDAARIAYDRKQKVYEAQGAVRITSGDRSIEADWAQLDTNNQEVELRGHVLLRYGKDWLRGEHVFWNLEKETGRMESGMVFFAENHFYVQGKQISKTGPTNYELQDGFLTTCDPANPDWALRYQQMKVDTDGIAWARQTTFRVHDVPLLYAPLIALPVQQKRQSGFLFPWAGFSELNGLEGELPLYWAIRQDMDATFYGRYMEKRGWMSGLEYRVANPKWGEGIWLFNYLHDQADKDHLRDLGYPFEQQDRFWLRSRHSFDLPYQIEGRLDLDVVSDRNFLKEFEKGSTSYGYTDEMFRRFFGRGVLNDKSVLARESSLYLDRRTESTLLSLDVRYWDQLDRSLDEFTLQRLPALAFDIVPSWTGSLPLYYDLESSWVNYWRREGDRGHRIDVHPRVHYPLHWRNYLDLEPSFGLHATSYAVDWEQDSRGEWQGRVLPDVRLDFSSRLNRVYDFSMGEYRALQHSIRPEILYVYMPEVDQDHIPQFDSLDAIEERHGITYGISNFLTSRVVQKDAKGNTVTSYREFARFRVAQTLNIRPSTSARPFGLDSGLLPDPHPDAESDSDSDERRLSDVNVLLDVMPGRYVTLTYDTDISPDEGSVAHHDIYTTLDSGRGHVVRLGYQFWDGSIIDEIIAQTDIKILPNLYFSTYHDYSLDRNELFRQGYGIKYQHGCWGIGFAFEREDEDQRVAVSVNLLGLGELGGHYSFGESEYMTGLP